MINRTLAPAFRQVEHIQIIEATEDLLDNGIKTFTVNAGEQDLVRIEFIFNNVNWNLAKPLQALTVNSMLNDGTSKLTASQIAEQIDFYGAFLQTDYSFDHSIVTLYTLNKHLESVLPVVKAIFTESVFPQEELDTFKRNQKQKLSVSLEKNDFLGRRAFNNILFGDTLYGYTNENKDYDKISRDELLEYFRDGYQPANCTIVLAGKITGETKKALNTYFGSNWNSVDTFKENNFSFSTGKGLEHFIEKPEALQSAIRLGQFAVNRSHADFAGLQVLNTILGGYFGSRLMANIREDKGYTYGIGSAIASLKNAGYLVIASEVGADVCQAALGEIEKEINILRTTTVTSEELSLVKNYMLGSLLGDLENAFSHADKFKNIYFFGLGYDYYQTYVETIKTMSSETLLGLANTYLDFDKFEKVIVGRK